MLLTDIEKDSLNSRETAALHCRQVIIMWKLQIQWGKVVFINLATKLESSWSHQCYFSVYIESMY